MKNKVMKTALLASVVAILSACGGGGNDSQPATQATNNVPAANNNQSGHANQASNGNVVDTGSKANNVGSQLNNNPVSSTNNQAGSKPANNGSQTNNQSPNSGSQANNNSSSSTGNQAGSKPANNGSQANNQSPNSGSQTNANNVLTLNENPHLFANENKFLVKPPTAAQKQQLDIALAETNKLRAEKGLPALKYDATLAAYAQRRAEEIVGRFDHDLPDGNLPYHVNIAKGGSGENLASGRATGAATIEQWRNSPGHYANMVRPGFTKIGIGMALVPGSKQVYHWVQIFGFDDTETNYVFDTNPQRSLENVTADVGRYLPAVKWLHVDGVDIQLHHVAGNGSWHDFKGGAYNGISNGYVDTRFGVVRKDADAYKVFYRGVNTEYEDMPQTGSANYTGKAVITDGKTLNTNLDAQFKADFGNKKLTGVLSEKGQRVVDINAHIRGSSFHSPQNAPVETQGSFFGKTANELGGVFHENATGKFGAFGAKR